MKTIRGLASAKYFIISPVMVISVSVLSRLRNSTFDSIFLSEKGSVSFDKLFLAECFLASICFYLWVLFASSKNSLSKLIGYGLGILFWSVFITNRLDDILLTNYLYYSREGTTNSFSGTMATVMVFLLPILMKFIVIGKEDRVDRAKNPPIKPQDITKEEIEESRKKSLKIEYRLIDEKVRLTALEKRFNSIPIGIDNPKLQSEKANLESKIFDQRAVVRELQSQIKGYKKSWQ